MHTEILKIETPAQFASALDVAAVLLKRGEVVAVPTETVYGLAANAHDERAVRRIYEVKGRPSANPIIVHVHSLAMARSCCEQWPAAAGRLAGAFWPGPLTVVVPKSASIPSIVTAGGDTVGIRWPSHPFLQQLIGKCGFPLAAPSANLSNELSPTTGDHVVGMLTGRIPLIVDAGASNVGIESTVIDVTSNPPRILRPGMISADQIGKILQLHVVEGTEEGKTLRSPGLLQKHYAPKARLIIAQWRNEPELKKLVEALPVPPSKVSIIAHEHIPQTELFGRVSVIPHDPEAYARALYAELHNCDRAGAKFILAEALPPGAEWAGLRDRLKRASGEL